MHCVQASHLRELLAAAETECECVSVSSSVSVSSNVSVSVSLKRESQGAINCRPIPSIRTVRWMLRRLAVAD